MEENLFELAYQTELASCTSEQFPAIIKGTYVEKLAVYNADDILIYYDIRKEDWTSDQSIKGEYGTAQKMRVCYEIGGGSVVCMMPCRDL